MLGLVAQRRSIKEIAVELVTNEHRVKNHMKNVLTELQNRSRRDATAYGVAQGGFRDGERA